MLRPVSLSFTHTEIVGIGYIVRISIMLVEENFPVVGERDVIVKGMRAVDARIALFAGLCQPYDPAPVPCTMPLGEALSLECALRIFEHFLQDRDYGSLIPCIADLLAAVFARVRPAIVEQYPAFGKELSRIDRLQVQQ